MNMTTTLFQKAMKAILLVICCFLFQSSLIHAQCDNDVIAPICIAPADIVIGSYDYTLLNINYSDTLDLQLHFGNATATDNCPVYTMELSPQIDELSGCEYILIIRREFIAIDAAGNESAIATQVISVQNDEKYILQIPSDDIQDSLSINQNFGLIATGYSDINYDYNCDDIIDKTDRNWIVADWCKTNDTILQTPLILPRLDRDGDGTLGDSYSVIIENDSVFIWENGIKESFLGISISGFYEYEQEIYHNSIEPGDGILVEGTLFLDNNEDCNFDTGEIGLADRKITLNSLLTGLSRTITSDANGYYSTYICPGDTSFTLSLNLAIDYMGACASSYTQTVPFGTNQVNADLPVNIEFECDLLTVSMITPRLRLCSDQNYYFVQYCNYGLDPVSGSTIEIELDQYLTLIDSEIPGTLNGNLWSFDLPTVAPTACGQFFIRVDVDCDAPFGQTHCSRAEIFTPNNCIVPGPNWSGATVTLDAECESDSIRFLSLIHI